MVCKEEVGLERVRGLFANLSPARWLALLFVTVLGLHAPNARSTPSTEAGTLRVLAWPGYAEPEVVSSFEARTGTRVAVTVIDTDEALWQRIGEAEHNPRGGYDVFAVNTAELQRHIASNRVQAIQVDLIRNVQNQLPRFRKLSGIPGLVRSGPRGEQVFGIPYTYSAMGLIYDKRQWPQPPQSVQALWDPALQGKVVIYNGGTHNFSLAAQSLGWATPFRIPEGQWQAAAEQLIALRRNAVSVYRQPEESVRLFMRHHAALMFANYGMQQVQLLRAAGADIGYVIPREGALAWLDCWAIPRNARNVALAHAWIDHLLGPQASQLLVTRQGLHSTVAEASTPAGSAQQLLWLAPVEDAPRRERLWSRIHSGDRLGKVMAP
ncbi:MAG: extracellular solute-binding protein [Proteobacteria bacterium]|nr:extracellular solute-binding protein [Pseudomonadota bacterium]